MSNDRWEYKVIPAPRSFWGQHSPEKMTEVLNREGAQGWELVNAVMNGLQLILFMKRAR